MTDIARLAIEVDPKQLQAAINQLEKLSVASAKAEVAAKKLEKTEASAALAIANANRQAATQAAQAAAANKTMSVSQKQAAAEGRRQAEAAYQAAKGTDLQAAASLKAAQAALQQSEAAQKLIQSNQGVESSAQSAAAAQDRSMRNMGRLAGQQQANMTNIAAQFQDIGVTAAMGMNPMMIGLQQGAQLTGVWGSVTGTTAQKLKTFGSAILAVLSPMSLLIIAITAGIAYLIQWGMEAFNAGKEVKSLETAMGALTGMQSALGEMFDMTSGKIENNTELIRLNTLQTILNAQAKAAQLAAESKGVLGSIGGWGKGAGPGQGFGYWIGSEERRQRQQNITELKGLALAYEQTAISAEQAAKMVSQMDLRGTGFTKEELQSAFIAGGMAKEIGKIADKAMESFDKGILDPSLRTPAKSKKSRGKSEGEKFSDLMAGGALDLQKLQQEAELINLTGYAAEYAAARYDLMNKAREQEIDLSTGNRQAMVDETAKKIAQQKETNRLIQFTKDYNKSTDDSVRAIDAQVDAYGLVGYAARYYTAVVEGENAARAAGLKTINAEVRALIESNAAKIANAQTTDDNASFYKKYTDELKKSSESLAIEVGALGMATDAAELYRFKQELINDANARGITINKEKLAGLLAEKSAQIATAKEMDKYKGAVNDAKDAIRGMVSDLKSGLLQGKSLFETWGNAVLKVIDNIIERGINRLLEKMFEVNQASGGKGFFGTLTSLFGGIGGGAGGGAIDSGLSSMGSTSTMYAAKGAAFTNSVVHKPTAFFAKGGTPGVMGEAGPEAIMPLQRGPDGSLGVQMYGGGTNSEPTVVQVIPSEYFDVVVDQRAAKVAVPMVVQGALVANKVSENTSARRQRRRIS